jgi:hypothetical protein
MMLSLKFKFIILSIEEWILKQSFNIEYVRLRMFLNPNLIDDSIKLIADNQRKIHSLRKD